MHRHSEFDIYVFFFSGFTSFNVVVYVVFLSQCISLLSKVFEYFFFKFKINYVKVNSKKLSKIDD